MNAFHDVSDAFAGLLPEVFSSADWMPFAERYCGLKQGPLGLDFSGATNTR
jgi:hypothetical protein